MNPMVAGIETNARAATALFRRYLRPYPLSDLERAILEAAEGQASLDAILASLTTATTDEPAVRAAISRLREKHLVQMREIDSNVPLSSLSFTQEGSSRDLEYSD
jgi:hypothetical protein